MTPFVAFGYRKTKTDKHKLEIDPSAGSVVQDIFKMKLRGMSQDAIANRLNELGILSPFEYKISSGSHYETGFRQKEQALWSSVTVRRILENEVYIGNLVQGKRTTPNHKVKQTYVKPEDDWIRIEKNHEPLVSDRDFEIVQRLLGMDTRTSPDQKQVYLLSGIAVCADCGAPMTRKVSTVAGKNMLIIYVPQIKNKTLFQSQNTGKGSGKCRTGDVETAYPEHSAPEKSPGICWYCAISGDQYEEAAGQAGEEKTGDRTL